MFRYYAMGSYRIMIIDWSIDSVMLMIFQMFMNWNNHDSIQKHDPARISLVNYSLNSPNNVLLNRCRMQFHTNKKNYIFYVLDYCWRHRKYMYVASSRSFTKYIQSRQKKKYFLSVIYGLHRREPRTLLDEERERIISRIIQTSRPFSACFHFRPCDLSCYILLNFLL